MRCSKLRRRTIDHAPGTFDSQVLANQQQCRRSRTATRRSQHARNLEHPWFDHVVSATLLDGAVIALRKLTFADAVDVVRLYETLSDDECYYHFSTAHPAHLQTSALSLTEPSDTQYALGAFGSGGLLGVASYYVETATTGRAEVAVVVAHSEHLRGVVRRCFAGSLRSPRKMVCVISSQPAPRSRSRPAPLPQCLHRGEAAGPSGESVTDESHRLPRYIDARAGHPDRLPPAGSAPVVPRSATSRSCRGEIRTSRCSRRHVHRWPTRQWPTLGGRVLSESSPDGRIYRNPSAAATSRPAECRRAPSPRRRQPLAVRASGPAKTRPASQRYETPASVRTRIPLVSESHFSVEE